VPQLSNSRPGKTASWSRFTGPAVVLLAAAVAVAPLLAHGPSCGHDFDFHLVSWFDCLNSWRQGIPYPHWTPSANFGAGEPRFVFYPPLTWMLGAALGLVLPWTLVPVALTFLLLALTGLATQALAREMLPDSISDGAATLAGCAALYSGYALFTAYERTAFGELAGGFWIPLLLLFALRDGGSDAPGRKCPLARKILNGSALPLALVVAGCWLSNAPLGVMGCYLLAAVAVAAALLAQSWAPVLRAALAAALGIALSSLYLIPAACEQRWVDVRQAIDDPGLLIENSWLFARHASPALAFHDVELHRVSLIAASMIAVALVCLLLSWWRGKLTLKNQSHLLRWWIPLALIPFAVLFLQFPVSLPAWNLLPKLRFLQFPWRWLVVLEAPLAIFFAAAIWPGKSARPWRRVAVAALCAVGFLAVTAFTAHNFFQTCDDEDAVPSMISVYRTGAGFEGTDEYTPPGAGNALVPTGLPAACLTADSATVLGALPDNQKGQEQDGQDSGDAHPIWKPAQGSCEAILRWQSDQPEHQRLQALIPHAGFLILRLCAYPAWRITVNGQSLASLPRRDDGLIAVPVPQGPIDLAVNWTTTPDVIAGRWLSALAALLLAGLWLLERKLSRTRLS
jgi:hypothetical protein